MVDLRTITTIEYGPALAVRAPLDTETARESRVPCTFKRLFQAYNSLVTIHGT